MIHVICLVCQWSQSYDWSVQKPECTICAHIRACAGMSDAAKGAIQSWTLNKIIAECASVLLLRSYVCRYWYWPGLGDPCQLMCAAYLRSWPRPGPLPEILPINFVPCSPHVADLFLFLSKQISRRQIWDKQLAINKVDCKQIYTIFCKKLRNKCNKSTPMWQNHIRQRKNVENDKTPKFKVKIVRKTDVRESLQSKMWDIQVHLHHWTEWTLRIHGSFIKKSQLI